MPKKRDKGKRANHSSSPRGWNKRMIFVGVATLAVASVVTWGSLDSGKRAIPEKDGLPLYEFLLEEIPEVVSQVPCSCCDETLEWCYEGGCPPS